MLQDGLIKLKDPSVLECRKDTPEEKEYDEEDINMRKDEIFKMDTKILQPFHHNRGDSGLKDRDLSSSRKSLKKSETKKKMKALGKTN